MLPSPRSTEIPVEAVALVEVLGHRKIRTKDPWAGPPKERAADEDHRERREEEPIALGCRADRQARRRQRRERPIPSWHESSREHDRASRLRILCSTPEEVGAAIVGPLGS
jgi:hypothetical protein